MSKRTDTAADRNSAVRRPDEQAVPEREQAVPEREQAVPEREQAPSALDPHSQLLHVTDPVRIRALAHPVRLDLLSIIDDRGEATATQCAEALGETVANCSFHLRTLAAAGFIERAPARGREKPWRSTSRGRTFEPDLADPSSRLALSEMAGLSMGREVERVRRFLESAGTPPQGWEDTVVVAQSAFYATADELRALTAAVVGLTATFRERKQDPSLRPPGARLARLFATVNPDEYPSQEVE